MKKNITLLPIILAAVFLSFAGIGLAQGPEIITARVDRTELSTDEMLNLTVEIHAPVLHAPVLNGPRPALPRLQGFNVVGSSSSSQISIINGAMSSQVAYSYRLQPYQAGDLVIEPVQVTLEGQTYSTEAITVRVTQGSGAPPAPSAQRQVPAAPLPSQPAPSAEELTGQDLFVEAEIDNPRPYVGQQVGYTFRFYQAVNLWDQPRYEPPSFQGFWNEHQTEQQEYQVQVAGRTYRVTEVQTILFPSVVGPLTVEPARLTTPGSLFRSGRTLQTRPVALEVQPLPPDAPQGFNGAVGQFALEATVDATQGRVNEPLTWRVTLSGRGNLSAAPDPIWPEMSGWRDFESQATVHSQVQDGGVVGSRVYERLLVPSIEGELTLAPLVYTFFDPALGEYQTITTEPIAVSIAPGAVDAPPALPVDGRRGAVEEIAGDIRHLKPVPAGLGSEDQPVTASALYWVAWGFPLLGAVGFFAWQRREHYWQNNLGLARSSQARKRAKQAIARARKQGYDAYGAAGLILTTYLADKLDRPVAGLTHHALAALLAEQGVSADLRERVKVCLVSNELGRFMPGADNVDHARSLLVETDILISALEKAL